MTTAREERLSALKVVETPPDLLAALKELAKLKEEDVARISEAQFVNLLLPVLTDTTGKADLRVWQDLAGTVLRPIEVMDSAGNALFRVPSLMRRLNTRENPKDPNQAMSQIMGAARAHLNRHPILGATFIQANLARVGVDNRIDYDTVRQWNAILKRYGKPLIPVDLPEDETTTKDKPKDVGNIFSDEEEAL